MTHSALTLSKASIQTLTEAEFPQSRYPFIEECLKVINHAKTHGTPISEESKILVFNVSELHRSSQFRKTDREEISNWIYDLEDFGVLSPEFQIVKGGRPGIFRRLEDVMAQGLPEDCERWLVARHAGNYKFEKEQSELKREPVFNLIQTEEELEAELAGLKTAQAGLEAGQPLPAVHTDARALIDFPAMIGGYCLYFKKGQLISEPSVVRTLLEGGMPVALVTEGEVTRVHCRKCMFTNVEPASGVYQFDRGQIFIRFLHDTSLLFNGFLIQAKRDMVYTSPELVRFLLENKDQFMFEQVQENVDFIVCARCNTVTFMNNGEHK